MTSLKKWLRRLRTLVWTAAALLIIGAAVLVGIGKLLMPYSERFKPRLEAVLAEPAQHRRVREVLGAQADGEDDAELHGRSVTDASSPVNSCLVTWPSGQRTSITPARPGNDTAAVDCVR